jgi:hypothetical protein
MIIENLKHQLNVYKSRRSNLYLHILDNEILDEISQLDIVIQELEHTINAYENTIKLPFKEVI